MSTNQVRITKNNKVAPILTFVADILQQSQLSRAQTANSPGVARPGGILVQNRSTKNIRLASQLSKSNQPVPDKVSSALDFKKLEQKYVDLVASIQGLFLFINRKYFEQGPDEVQESYKRKQDEFGYERIDPLQLVELCKELMDLICVFQLKTNELTSNYKLLKDADEESKDYIWLLQKSERDMRQSIRESQQLKQQCENFKLKIKSNEKQIELLTQYTQKAMEEMKKEFIFAIDLLAERESGLQTLKEEIRHKNEVIRSLDEQLISILILEHKINYMGNKHDKEREKNHYEQDDKLKRHEKQVREHIGKDNQNKDARIIHLQAVLKQSQMQKEILERDLKSKLDKMSKSVETQNIQLQVRYSKMNKLQDQLTDQRHLESLFIKANHLLITKV